MSFPSRCAGERKFTPLFACSPVVRHTACTNCHDLRSELSNLAASLEALQQSRREDHVNWARMRQVLEAKTNALQHAKERASQRRAAKRKGDVGDGGEQDVKKVKVESEATGQADVAVNQVQGTETSACPLNVPALERVKSSEVPGEAVPAVMVDETPPFPAGTVVSAKPKALGASSLPNTPERERAQKGTQKVSPMAMNAVGKAEDVGG